MTCRRPHNNRNAIHRQPKVQAYGDVAILTYNFLGVTKNADGETSPMLAKSTRVYVKKGGEWKLVHANFAPLGND
jgi:ketosteroid isomerase-like protein